MARSYDYILDLKQKVTSSWYKEFTSKEGNSLEELLQSGRMFIDERNNIVFIMSGYKDVDDKGNSFNFISYGDYIRAIANPDIFDQNKWRYNYIDAGFVPIYMLPTFYIHPDLLMHKRSILLKEYFQSIYNKEVFDFPYTSFKVATAQNDMQDLYMKKKDVVDVFESCEGDFNKARLSVIADEVEKHIMNYITRENLLSSIIKGE